MLYRLVESFYDYCPASLESQCRSQLVVPGCSIVDVPCSSIYPSMTLAAGWYYHAMVYCREPTLQACIGHLHHGVESDMLQPLGPHSLLNY